MIVEIYIIAKVSHSENFLLPLGKHENLLLLYSPLFSFDRVEQPLN